MLIVSRVRKDLTNDEVKIRLDKHIDKSEIFGGCWYWTGSRSIRGYGRFQYKGKIVGAHRVTYEVYKGPIPEGLFILHSCDNPSCVNPNHLIEGTQKDNMRDMFGKNRYPMEKLYQPGPDHHNAKLTWEQVQEIRFLYAQGEITQWDLGVKFGVTQPVINRVVRNKGYKL